MGRELGRISGPLLADNLKRNGTNLAFDNQVLYLDVVNNRVGFNSNSPVSDVYTPTAINTTNLLATTADIGNWVISSNTIQQVTSSITISPNQSSNPTIVMPELATSNLNISVNTISDTVTNDSINISPNGIGAINFANGNGNVQVTVTGNLHAEGTITWDGNITLGSSSSDTVAFDGEINSNIIPSVTNTYTLGVNGANLSWATTYVNNFYLTTLTTASITTGSLTGSGTNNLNSNTTIGTTSSNTLSITAEINSNLIPSVTNTDNLGSSSYYWSNGYYSTLTDSVISFSSNVVSIPSSTNTSLQLNANGTGKVVFSALNLTNNSTISGTLNVTSATSLKNTNTGSITQTGDFNQTGNSNLTGNLTTTAGNLYVYGTYTDIGEFNFDSSTITNSVSNHNITFNANGTGNVVVENLSFNNNNIINTYAGASTTTQKSIFLTPDGTGNVLISSSSSLILPIGDDGVNVLSSNGQVRFNDSNKNIEGYNNSGYVNFIDLYSQDQKTYITGELTPNSADNTLRFSVDSTVTTTITSTALTNYNLYAGNINVNSNIISDLTNSNTITITPSGTGVVNFNGTNRLYNNNIYTPSFSGLIFYSTGDGYVKFEGTYGIKVPSGSSNNYPVSPQTGTTRFNTTNDQLEVYNGTSWVAAYGESSSITADDVTGIVTIYTLILGL
jgi:hypothetical protein